MKDNVIRGIDWGKKEEIKEPELPYLTEVHLAPMIGLLPLLLKHGTLQVNGDLNGNVIEGDVTFPIEQGMVTIHYDAGIASKNIKVSFNNGFKFEGMFPEGLGVLTYPDGDMYYQGAMKYCRMNGKGTLYYKMYPGYVEHPRQEGSWKDGLRHGEFTCYNDDGSFFTETIFEDDEDDLADCVYFDEEDFDEEDKD